MILSTPSAERREKQEKLQTKKLGRKLIKTNVKDNKYLRQIARDGKKKFPGTVRVKVVGSRLDSNRTNLIRTFVFNLVQF